MVEARTSATLNTVGNTLGKYWMYILHYSVQVHAWEVLYGICKISLNLHKNMLLETPVRSIA